MSQGENNNGEFTREEHEILFNITCTFTVIAVTVLSFVVYMYLRFQELRKRSYEQVFTLACTSICANLAYILQPPDRVNETGTWQCTMQGFTMNFFDMATVGWTTVIAFSLYRAVVQQRKAVGRLTQHGCVWGVAFLLSAMPLITESYGNSGPWCWLNGRQPAGTIFRFVSFYIPLWIAFAANAVIYFQVSQTLRRFAALSLGPGTTGDQRLLTMAQHLRFYPLIFVVSWLANTVIRVVQAAYVGANGDFNFALVHVILHGTFYQSVGNAFAYGLNDSVKAKARELAQAIETSRSLWPLLAVERQAGAAEDDFEVEALSVEKGVERPAV